MQPNTDWTMCSEPFELNKIWMNAYNIKNFLIKLNELSKVNETVNTDLVIRMLEEKLSVHNDLDEKLALDVAIAQKKLKTCTLEQREKNAQIVPFINDCITEYRKVNNIRTSNQIAVNSQKSWIYFQQLFAAIPNNGTTLREDTNETTVDSTVTTITRRAKHLINEFRSYRENLTRAHHLDAQNLLLTEKTQLNIVLSDESMRQQVRVLREDLLRAQEKIARGVEKLSTKCDELLADLEVAIEGIPEQGTDYEKIKRDTKLKYEAQVRV